MTDPLPNLVGYQEYVDWMGSRVLTLADIWPSETHAMIVGLNPAPTSVEIGHYYQGKTGQRQLGKLADSGVFEKPAPGEFFEPAALTAGVGFSDLVKRPSVGENDVSSAEMEFGRKTLERALAEREVGLVICVFRHPVEALLGRVGPPGYQERRTSWGARVFRMPGPFDARDAAAAVMATLDWR